MKRNSLVRFGLAAILWIAGVTAPAQTPASPGSIGNPTTRDVTQQMGLTQRLGVLVPKDLPFTDESGKEIKFGDLMGKRPLLVLPVFYRCQSACLLEMDSLAKALRKTQRVVPGEEFDVVFVSIHPKETWELGRATEARMMEAYGRPETAPGWHYLVGPQKSITELTDALGFKFTYDAEKDLINHPVAAIFITLDGRISSYIANGVNYPTTVLETGTQRAANNQIGQKTDVYLFGCLMIDPATGQRSLVIHNVLRLAAALTVIVLVCSIAYMSHKYRRESVPASRKPEG